MDEQTVIDRITEVENLTDALDDDDANWLLDWGIQRAIPMVTIVEDPEVAGSKLNEIMAVMRLLNRIAPDCQVKSAADLASELATLEQAWTKAFGSMPLAIEQTTQSAADLLLYSLATGVASDSPRQAMAAIIEWFEKDYPSGAK